MTLNEALKIINARKGTGEQKPHFLVCGFEPLNLATLLRAHLLQRLPDDDVDVSAGLYGDLTGNLELAMSSAAIAAAVVIEWADIDPRMGLRSAGGWSNSAKADILAATPRRYAHLETLIARLGARMPVVIVPPSLPLPPFGATIRGQASLIELELESQLASFLVQAGRAAGVRVLPRQLMPELMPNGSGLDPRGEFLAGCPHTIACSNGIAETVTACLWQTAPKKGLITDLDNTLWAGIVGELGVAGVSWHQELRTQAHGLYQQMLGHLASSGVLLGVASKNEISAVEAALARNDLLMDATALFPVCASWGPKSESVARILRVWNIGASDVVFVDDSAMELEEVRQSFPGITCIEFPQKDAGKLWKVLGELRDLFGKPTFTHEDTLRQASIRAASHLQEAGGGQASAEFLRSLAGTVNVQWTMDADDKRALDLINKTNQFNLNGRRINEGEWRRLLAESGAVVAVVSYRDKFGPLGRIAVLAGIRSGNEVQISHWVMSCRAFSRMIEHHTLDVLFGMPGVEVIEFSFQATERNQPLQTFLRAAGMVANGEGVIRLPRTSYMQGRTELPHQVSETTEGLNGPR
ncbi:MAG: FkbH like protein [Bryobacterales bacterium]|nr:FkbH like protein [Bryobacterales bacterium]